MPAVGSTVQRIRGRVSRVAHNRFHHRPVSNPRVHYKVTLVLECTYVQCIFEGIQLEMYCTCRCACSFTMACIVHFTCS